MKIAIESLTSLIVFAIISAITFLVFGKTKKSHKILFFIASLMIATITLRAIDRFLGI